MLPSWGRQPVLGTEGTAADYLEWVTERRLAGMDRAGRGAPGISMALGALDFLGGPGEVIIILLLCQRDMA